MNFIIWNSNPSNRSKVKRKKLYLFFKNSGFSGLAVVFEYPVGYSVRRDVRHRTRIHSLVPCHWAVQFFGSSNGHRHRRHRQLGRQFHRRSRIPSYSGLLIQFNPLQFNSIFKNSNDLFDTGSYWPLRVRHFRRFPRLFHLVHLEKSAGD